MSFSFRRFPAIGLTLLATAIWRPGAAQQGADRAPIFEPTPLPNALEVPALSRRSGARTAQAAQAAAGETQSESQDFSLELQYEADGAYVDFPTLLELIRAVDERGRGEWDGLTGVLRLTAGGRNLQALANQPVLVIDGKYNRVAKPLRIRGGNVLVPLESVKALLAALDFEIEIEPDAAAFASDETDGTRRSAGGSSGADSKAPVQLRRAPQSGSGDANPRAGSSGRRAADMAASGQPILPGGALLSSVGDRSIPALDIPQVDETVAGLTWSQLADFAHRRLPGRLTIIYDAPLGGIAGRIDRLVSRALGLNVETLEIESGRGNADLIAQVSRTRPDLVLDLTSVSAGELSDPGAGDFELWVVHEALWPASGRPIAGAPDPAGELYKLHQFQNLALGAMLRGELTRSFPERTVRFELAPSYLLRRVDAPSAAVLIPSEIYTRDEQAVDRTARSLAGGVIAYSRALESVISR